MSRYNEPFFTWTSTNYAMPPVGERKIVCTPTGEELIAKLVINKDVPIVPHLEWLDDYGTFVKVAYWMELEPLPLEIAMDQTLLKHGRKDA